MGLDGQALRFTPEKRNFDKSVPAREEDAQRYGIRVVPVFVADEQRIGSPLVLKLYSLMIWTKYNVGGTVKNHWGKATDSSIFSLHLTSKSDCLSIIRRLNGIK